MAASVTAGVMKPLIGKLTELLGEEYKKLTGVRKQAAFLRAELSAMKALLDKMELMDKLDPSAKNWRDHVREMSYDMENCIDDFIRDIEGVNEKAGFVREMAKRLSRLGRRHKIANRIKELKVLAMEANDRRERYKIDDCFDSSPGLVAVDPRISAICAEEAGLVGIDGPRKELTLMMTGTQLVVVSIVGFGGLGKTTLAKQVYDKIGGQFDCQAFVSVPQTPDVKSLLIGLQRKLGMKESSHSHELQDIIDPLREYLKHKRYFISVDALRDQSTWDILSCAFPENSNGSRVVITTRLDDVALSACQHDRACIYRMKPLEVQDSRRLFYNRVFGSENVCPPQFKEISAEILKKCGGSPLAIITIASQLASLEAKSPNEWDSIKNSFSANAWGQGYKIDDCVSLSPVAVTIDPRISVIYKKASELVGIDGPREELLRLLIASQKKLKVVSVVGFEGVGKTTLAKQVYDEIGGQFDSMAFISVSQRPDVKSLLIGLQRKLGMDGSSHSHELPDIIGRLKEYLKPKRYFILVDDLWDSSTWNIISCAFPENSNGSRVMVTTRVDEVALSACQHDRACIYRMKPLKEQDSEILFFDRAFGSKNVCPPQFKEISAVILKKCGGLPLAIITIGSLLASLEAKSPNEWDIIKNCFGAKFATKPVLEEMRGILNLSYMHLPVHLRPCLLYLGMYPEDVEIGRDDLVRQWMAEGLVCRSDGVDLEDIANGYFKDLMNRSLIQPVDAQGGEVVSCRVHAMLLDLILSKSTEDNFLSIAYNCEDMERLHSCKYKVHRLSLKSSVDGEIPECLATSMSQVRSYAQFGGSKYTPPLSQFKYMRVILFEFPDQWDMTVDLTSVGHLFLLRYLKVLAKSAEVALPTEIRGLVHLEVLELACNFTQSFPLDITRLANVLHLRLPSGTVLPKGIQNMKSIQTLHCSGISNSSLEDIKGLSELTNLKKLELSTPYGGQGLTFEHVDALVSSIGMLPDLKHISLDCKFECDGSHSRLFSLPDPPPSLEVVNLSTWEFSKVPIWIGELHCLRILKLRVLHLSSDEVRVLGELPSLVSATFQGLDVSQDKVVVSTGLFPVLEEACFCSDEDVTSCLSFEAGAMPKLQKLTMGFCWTEWRGATPAGMECLPCLQEIRLNPHGPGDVLADAVAAFKIAASVHPRHPSVTVQ